MKGGIFEWMVINPLLVFALITIIGLSVTYYVRTITIGQPVEIRTYSEYRWMNYLPSATLFYITYPNENWIALKEIALLPKYGVWSKSEFLNEFSSDYDLSTLIKYLNKLEKKLKKQDKTVFIKDRNGLIISIGLPKKYIEIHGYATFPEEYPYACYSQSTPIYSTSLKKNMRIKFVTCCQDIVSCSDYIAGPGRNECEEDPCGVSVNGCEEIYCNDEKIEDCKGRLREMICVEKNKIISDGGDNGYGGGGGGAR